jgi:thiol-disulfide isomerase/thioredoxin
MKYVIAVLFLLLSMALPALAGEARPFVRGSWQDLRQLHQGRPTVVHFWGVTCAPCMVEMPRWAKLSQADHDFDFVLVDADPVEEGSGGAAQMLAKMGLSQAESWSFADDFTERLRYEVDPKWRGELPLTLLIGRDGAVRKVVGSADFTDVQHWLRDQENAKR